jgi:hypothetical protein
VKTEFRKVTEEQLLGPPNSSTTLKRGTRQNSLSEFKQGSKFNGSVYFEGQEMTLRGTRACLFTLKDVLSLPSFKGG